MDVTVPHSRYEDFDMCCFDTAECFGEVGVEGDGSDLFVFDYESGNLNGFTSAGD
jgi:hypothetical protein